MTYAPKQLTDEDKQALGVLHPSVYLANGIPQVIAEPVPTVTCDVETEVDMTPHISDPETPLYDLVIDSDSPYFVSWNPLSSTISVNFAFNDLQGCPLGQKSMLVTVDDGGDYGSQGTALRNTQI